MALRLRLALHGACLLLCAASLCAQAPGDDSASGVPSGSGTAGDRNTGSGGTERGVQQGTSQDLPRDTGRAIDRAKDPFGNSQSQAPIYLYGRVVTDGGEPPERVLVRMDCGRGAVPQDYTDAKGRFSFEPGTNHTLVTVDASVSDAGAIGIYGGPPAGVPGSRRGPLELSGCLLQAELPGYRSDRMQLGKVRGLGGIDVGLIVLHRLEGLRGSTVSATSLAAPADAADDEALEREAKAQIDYFKKYGKKAKDDAKFGQMVFDLGKVGG